MKSTIDTLRVKMINHFPTIKDSHLNEVLDLYFQFAKKTLEELPKPDMTFVWGNVIIKRKDLLIIIHRIQLILDEDLEVPELQMLNVLKLVLKGNYADLRNYMEHTPKEEQKEFLIDTQNIFKEHLNHLNIKYKNEPEPRSKSESKSESASNEE